MKELIDFLRSNLCEKFIVICSKQIKKEIINKLLVNRLLVNISFKQKEEVTRDILGYYLKDAYIKLANDENIPCELAKIKLNNSIYIDEIKEEDKNQKIKELINIKKKYQEDFINNDLVKNFYKNKIIITINYYHNNDLLNKSLNIIRDFSLVKEFNLYTISNKKHSLWKFNSMKEEVFYVTKVVAGLINDGKDVSNIKFNKVSGEYITLLKEAFSIYNIDIDVDLPTKLLDYEAIKRIYSLFLNNQELLFSDCLKVIKEDVEKLDEFLFSSINSVFNEYLEKDYYVGSIVKSLEYDLKNKSVDKNKYKNIIEFVDVFEEVIDEDEIFFILGCNQGKIPLIHKDDDYLLDYEKKKLNLITSLEKNISEKKKLLDFIKSCHNLYLSYPNISLSQQLFVSSFLDNLGEDIVYQTEIDSSKEDVSVSYSEDNELLDFRRKLDLNNKYGITNDATYIYSKKHSWLLDRKYLPKYNGIHSSKLEDTFKKGINLSYTSLNEYAECPFKYYIRRILKIKKDTNSEALFIGNLFHYCLNMILLEDDIKDINSFLDKTIANYLKQENYQLTSSDKFYLKMYKSVLISNYEFLMLQKKYSNFKIEGLEKSYKVIINRKYKVLLQGKIDKVMSFVINNEKYAVVVDYKTGSTDFDFNEIIHGLDMQILVYYYFLNSNDKYKFAGGYLQGVLPNSCFNYIEGETITSQLKDYQLLNGYSIDDKNIISEIDPNYNNDSKLIKGLKLKNDGSFNSYSLNRVISEEDFNNLLDIVKKNIVDMIDKIFNLEFDIAPKKIGSRITCKFCEYNEICYIDKRDIIEVKEYKYLEFIRGDNDAF